MPNSDVEGDVAHAHQPFFARIDRPMNALQFAADGLHTRKLCSRISSTDVHF